MSNDNLGKPLYIYIVLDCEAPQKDTVWSVHLTREGAIESQRQLNEMRGGRACTSIIEEQVA